MDGFAAARLPARGGRRGGRARGRRPLVRRASDRTASCARCAAAATTATPALARAYGESRRRAGARARARASSTSRASASCRWTTGAAASAPAPTRPMTATSTPTARTPASGPPCSRACCDAAGDLHPVLALLPGLEHRLGGLGRGLEAQLRCCRWSARWCAAPAPTRAFTRTTGRATRCGSTRTGASGRAPPRTATTRAARRRSAATAGSARAAGRASRAGATPATSRGALRRVGASARRAAASAAPAVQPDAAGVGLPRAHLYRRGPAADPAGVAWRRTGTARRTPASAAVAKGGVPGSRERQVLSVGARAQVVEHGADPRHSACGQCAASGAPGAALNSPTRERSSYEARGWIVLTAVVGLLAAAPSAPAQSTVTVSATGCQPSTRGCSTSLTGSITPSPRRSSISRSSRA